MSERPIKIRIQGLHKRFGAKQVLDGIDLEVALGESGRAEGSGSWSVT